MTPLNPQPGVPRHRVLVPRGLFLPLQPLPQICLVRGSWGELRCPSTPLLGVQRGGGTGVSFWGHLWHCRDPFFPHRDSLELMGCQEALAALGTPGPPASR